jgi:hypothetical protein
VIKQKRERWQIIALCAAALIVLLIFLQQHGPYKVRGDVFAGPALARFAAPQC